MEPTPAPVHQPGAPERRGEGGLPLLISPQYVRAYLTTWMTLQSLCWNILSLYDVFFLKTMFFHKSQIGTK